MSLASLNIAKEEGYIWVTNFDENSLKDFYQKFEELEASPTVGIIPIVISSYGGEVFSMFAMRDLVKSSKKPVMTVVLGKAMSCGASLAAAGTKGMRFISPASCFMIHESSGGFHGKVSDIKNESEASVLLNEQMFDYLAKDSGNSVLTIKKHMHKKNNADWYLSPEEAVSLGFVDQIAIPRLFMEPSRVGIMVSKQKSKKTAKKTTKRLGKKKKNNVAKKNKKR